MVLQEDRKYWPEKKKQSQETDAALRVSQSHHTPTRLCYSHQVRKLRPREGGAQLAQVLVRVVAELRFELVWWLVAERLQGPVVILQS